MKLVVAEVWQGVRRLATTPWLTAVLVVTLGIVIGAGAFTVSLLDRTVFRPFRYRAPDRLVQVWESMPQLGIDRLGLSPPDYLDLAGETEAFEELAAIRRETLYLDGDGEPEEVTGARITADPLALFGLGAKVGRSFSAVEVKEATRVALISEELWRRRFAASHGAVGASLTLNDEVYTIIGVAPAEIWYPFKVSVWLPLALNYDDGERGNRYLGTVGRLRAAGALPAVADRLRNLAGRLAADHPHTNDGVEVVVVRLGDQLRAEAGSALVFTAAALGGLLLIAAVTIANSLTARGVERRRELAVRIACGAGKLRLARLLLIENTLVCLAGGTLGVLLATPGERVLAALDPDAFQDSGVGGGFASIALAGLAIALLIAVAVALALWLQALTGRWATPLREGAQTEGIPHGRLKQAFLVTQVSLCLILMVGCGLLLTTVRNLRAVDPGFVTDGVITARVTLPFHRYGTPESRLAFFAAVLEALHSQPLAEQAGAVSHLPLTGSGPMSTFRIEGRPDPGDARDLRAGLRIVSPDYFRTMLIRVVRGRALTPQDDQAAPGAVVINEAMASAFWPGADPLGQEVVIGAPEETALYGRAVARRVVGIVSNVRHQALSTEPEPEMYVPVTQSPPRTLYLVVRSRSDPWAAVEPLRAAIAGVDPRQPLSDLETLRSVVDRSLRKTTFGAVVLASFGVISVLLTLLTVYGVVSYSVARKTREVGIRIAFGAGRGEIIRLILARTALLVVFGLAIGTASSLALMRLGRNLLFEVAPTELDVYLAVLALLFALSMLASWLPARTLARIQPSAALRVE